MTKQQQHLEYYEYVNNTVLHAFVEKLQKREVSLEEFSCKKVCSI